MIVSKQALSYMKIRDVALLFKVSTDPNLFFCKKRRITGSLQFLHCVVLHIFIVLSRIFHSCQKSKIMHEHQSQRIVKLVRVSSFSLCHYHHVIRYIWPLFQYLFRSWHILIVPVTYLQMSYFIKHKCSK